MQESLVRALRDRRAKIRGRWDALLRAEPVLSPLGHPDALVHLINWTLDEIFAALSDPLMPCHASTQGTMQPTAVCSCGRNPLLAFYAVAEQALHEGLVLAQAASAPLDPTVRDASLEELNAVLQRISRREIEAFCGVCQFREAMERQPLLLAEAR